MDKFSDVEKYIIDLAMFLKEKDKVMKLETLSQHLNEMGFYNHKGIPFSHHRMKKRSLSNTWLL